ncbi:methylated-DNA-[protein]-cysteine S-methyltransferase [Desulfacinum hydrothermale DSM 13146]|uniref:Methylated-DNA--protein-cysteine methyltransferase n=1 Tax=Desulfacinum hydrothermale DSM 13146 TaxID=1121390 RepID=A0A1W1XNI1_9BACT|nr:methylated-DNA--[protein]-cysteine S-methyltransferase [Desulfacinum hydrothermale]SMC25405.1 methylated-DNA-[protein]-cysteine S-methyltransferase [Desulfacinum hydrothermale DSM 13146]
MGGVWAQSLSTPLGIILAVATPRGVCRLQFVRPPLATAELLERFRSEIEPFLEGRTLWEGPNEHLQALSTQLQDYFEGKRGHPTVPVDFPGGTAFQREVWRQLRRIPYGATRTYQEVAQAMGRPKAVRAVGQACGRNPIPILVPCHRVVARSGLGGFSSGLDIKKRLLRLEGAFA